MCAHEASRCPPTTGSGVGRPQSTAPPALHFCIPPPTPQTSSALSLLLFHGASSHPGWSLWSPISVRLLNVERPKGHICVAQVSYLKGPHCSWQGPEAARCFCNCYSSTGKADSLLVLPWTVPLAQHLFNAAL